MVAEKSYLNLSVGLEKAGGCVDMIFVARQLVEKMREHEDPLFVLFIDLRKAYDSVPRDALWCVLDKYGMPSTMVLVI